MGDRRHGRYYGCLPAYGQGNRSAEMKQPLTQAGKHQKKWWIRCGSKTGNTFSGGYRLSHRQTIEIHIVRVTPKRYFLNHATSSTF